MTPEQLEIEIRHLATKEQVEGLRADTYKAVEGLRADLYKVKADLVQMHLTSIGIILVAMGLMIHFKI